MDISVDIPMKTANIPQWKAGFLADGRYSVIIDAGIIRLLITTSVIINKVTYGEKRGCELDFRTKTIL